MKATKKILLLLITIFVSCVESPKKKVVTNDTPLSDMEGFWNRIGTIQVVNGVPVDTLLIKDSENTDYRQIKVFNDGNIVWLNNAKNDTPWKGGDGGYGKFTVNSEKHITERLTAGTGFMANWVNDYKDSLNIPTRNVDLFIDYKGDRYSQMNGPNQEFMEYWERMPVLSSKATKLDGVWKRVYEISYINEIPVDTLAVPSDVILDVKIMKDGRFAYQVDQTGNYEANEPAYYGFGGYGHYDYDEEANILKEYGVFGSGTSIIDYEEGQRENFQTHQIEFFNDDLFIQIDNSWGSAASAEGSAGRGVVYRRVK